jgi:uncharacterized protein
MKRLYTVGRNYWIGFIAATRRPAKMHTDLRNGADATAFFQIVGTQDRKAMQDYLGENAPEDVRKEILSHLAKLPVGTAYFYQPDQDPALQLLHFRHRTTFDTTTTEITAAHKAIKPVLAEVDLTKLGEAMTAAREKAKADDPRELRKTIKELEAAVSRLKNQAVKPQAEIREVEKIVEVPVFDMRAVIDIQEAVEHYIEQNSLVLMRGLDAVIEKATQGARSRMPSKDQLHGRVAKPVERTGAGGFTSTSASSARPVRPAEPRRINNNTNNNNTPNLGKGERKVLAVLAQWPDGRLQKDLAFLTGYSARASTLGVILSKLRQLELVEPGQPVKATAAGLDAAGGVQELPQGPELLEHWLKHPRIGAGEEKVLRALIDAYPDALTHAELCERTAYSPDASTIGVILSKLRKLGLVEERARRVPDSFMEAIR